MRKTDGVIGRLAAIGIAFFGLVAIGLAQTSVASENLAARSNGRIASDQSFGQAFLVNGDGSHRQSVGPAGTVCQFWSPDGRRVTCNVFEEHGPVPAVVNRDGSHFRYLNRHLPLDFFCMYWSPAGGRLLCHSEGIKNSADAGFYTARASDAGGRVRITKTPKGYYDTAYGFSPDGSHILFGRFDFATNSGKLYSVDRHGGHRLRLSPPRLRLVDLSFFDQIDAGWSNNGKRVTFAARKTSSSQFTTSVFVVNADGTGLHRAAPWRVGAISAQWSPNSPLIAFTSCCQSNEVWVVHPDGTGLRQVTNSKTGMASIAPIWSPNGRKLLFNRLASSGNHSLWTVAIDGLNLSRLTGTDDLTHYSWGPWSPIR